ncbi:hypothetical protein SKAU_G00336680 [Synaphobranchus kaupii]|uniref:Uncharacterized protein n=1 Tax=Synaphobranchus kaupii TaxID=118154 RepID=A0A9Q1EMC3_SYNKA|nr:hypothetical protein SKAU_G00336680 [Synaphobranchus kaupii]
MTERAGPSATGVRARDRREARGAPRGPAGVRYNLRKKDNRLNGGGLVSFSGDGSRSDRGRRSLSRALFNECAPCVCEKRSPRTVEVTRGNKGSDNASSVSSPGSDTDRPPPPAARPARGLLGGRALSLGVESV